MNFPATLMLEKPQDFDRLVRSSCPQASSLILCTKPDATKNHDSAIVIAFDALVGTNKIPVCATIPLEAFMGIQQVIHSYYALRGRK